MKETEALITKALKYKESGLTEYEIGEELNVSKETAAWLLNKRKEKKPEGDVKIGWRSIGVYPERIASLSEILTDIIMEEADRYGIPHEKLIGRGRRKTTVIARRSALRRCRNELKLSLSELGNVFGGRHYTTVLHYLYS